MPVRLIDKATGAEVYVEEANLPAALASQKYIQPAAVAAHTGGEDVYVRPEALAQEGATTTAIDPARAALAAGAESRRSRNSGNVAMLKAAAGSAVKGATAGLVNPWQEAQEFQPVAAGVGTAVSYVAPFLIPGGEAELALQEPTAAEHIAGSLSSKFLHAGEVGAAEGTAGRAMEVSLARGKGAQLAEDIAQDGAQRGASAILKPEEAEAIGKMSRPELAAARKTEVAGVTAARGPETEAVVRDLGAHRDALLEDKLWLATKDADAKKIAGAELGAMAKKADTNIRTMLNNPKALVRQPSRILDALTQQETALERLAQNEPKLRELFAADESGTRAAALGKLPAALQRNRALQERVKGILSPATSDRLSAIEAAEAAMNAPAAKEGIAAQLLGGHVFHAASSAASAALGSIPFVGPMLGAKAAELAKHLVFGKGAGAIGEGITRAGATAKAFASKAARGPGAPVIASRVLAEARLGPKQEGGPGATLADHYARRSAELRAATAYDAMGVPRLRPDARAQIAQRLDPFRLVGSAGPVLADRIESIAARKAEFLSSKLPRRPDMPRLGMGAWHPSDMEMRKFARYVDAVERPDNVVQRLLDGTITPEDAEAFKAIYPERHADLVDRIVRETSQPTIAVPYKRRLALGIFSGVPTDPSTDPAVIAVLQGHFAKEMGSQGGSGNPTASPAFGSVKKSAPDPTPADKRSQGT